MGAFWAWLQLVFATYIHAPNTILGGADPIAQQIVWASSLACTLAIFVVVLVTHNRIVWYPWPKPTLFIGSHAAMAVGTAVLVCAPIFKTMQTSAIISATLFMGLGSGIAFLLWGHHLSRLSARLVLFDMSVYAILTASLTCMVSLLPHGIAAAFTAILPIVSGFSLYRETKITRSGISGHKGLESLGASRSLSMAIPGERSDAASSKSAQNVSLILLAIFVGIVFGLMRGIALPSFANATVATALGIAVSGALLFVTVVFYRQASELYLVCQISFPLLALGFLLLHFMENHTLPVVVFMAGHNYFYSLLWVLCTAKARLHPNGQAIPIFASGLLAFLGSSLAGALLAAALGKIGTELGQEISVVTLVVLYLFILALAYLLGNSKRMAEEELSRRARAFKLATHQIACEAGLSPREEEVFHLVALGKDRTEICEILGIATNTLKAHTRNVYVKLGIHSKKDAANMVEKRMSQE